MRTENRMSTLSRLMAATALCTVGTALSPALAAAQPTATIVISGLNNPRGLTVVPADKRGDAGHDRWALYVAEAGTGGTLRCAQIRGTVCVGRSGSVSRYQDGTQERILEGLPSYAPFFTGASAAAVGPSDVSFRGGRGFVLIGLAANPDVRAALGERFGWITRFHPNGSASFTVDVSAHEKQANPDGGPVESNPNGLVAGAGDRIVADAAANSLLSVAPSGAISTSAVFASRAQGRFTDAVPTSVAVGPDGAYYVGELTGLPFAPGAAQIWRVVPGRAAQVLCAGFSFVTDLDFDANGNLYVLEHASGPSGPFAGTPGQLLRVGRDCSRTTVATGLPAPTSVAIGPDGDAYVSINGTSPQIGAVIRIRPEDAPSGHDHGPSVPSDGRAGRLAPHSGNWGS
jgi:hypothetical protein